MSERFHLIHPSAVIDPLAVIAPDVNIGPFCVIRGAVTIGSGCVLDSHVVIHGPATIGERNYLGVGAVIGSEPQYRGWKREDNHKTSVIIGNDNSIRDFVTINRGTIDGGGLTRLGNNNYIMTYSHVGHDCHVHNNCTLINLTSLAGHVELFDNCLISANTSVQQRSRIGRLAMMGGHARTTRDIPPFLLAQGQTCISGMNLVGMRRAGIPRPNIDAVKQAYKILYFSNHTIPNALAEIEQCCGEVPEVREFIDFIRASKIGISRARTSTEAMREG